MKGAEGAVSRDDREEGGMFLMRKATCIKSDLHIISLAELLVLPLSQHHKCQVHLPVSTEEIDMRRPVCA